MSLRATVLRRVVGMERNEWLARAIAIVHPTAVPWLGLKFDLYASTHRDDAALRRGYALRSILNILLFSVALLSGNWALDRVVPHVYPSEIQRKFDYFNEHRDEYDVVFVGSSLVYRQVMPEVFDARLAEAGYPMRSFNFGMYGMRFHEMDELIRDILEVAPDRLRWVFVDASTFSNFGPFVPEKNWFTDRILWYHTPAQTVSALSGVVREDAPLGDRLTQVKGRLQQAGMRTFHIGRGTHYLDLWRERRSGEVPEPRSHRQGFGSLDDSYAAGSPGTVKRRDDFLKVEKWFNEKCEKLRDGTLPESDTSSFAYRRSVYRRQANFIERNGAEAVYLLAPAVKTYSVEHRLADDGVLEHLFAYNSPEVYPQFYEFSAHFDENHLTEKAATVYTRMIADDFIRLMNGRR